MIIPLLLKTVLASSFSFFQKKSREELYQNLLLELARTVASYTTNTLDDKIVDGIEKCLAGRDSGLQRKPTGPRKKR